ncbi:MAG: helix-turn-helix domain containing protein [Firmicutes bacterium]|nr:helix-turn-helix domain containing protein [Bacillota bacterium]
MAKKNPYDEKLKVLDENNTLNKNADKVKDVLFQNNPFFDKRDIVQVKYEMLRAVEKNGRPVSETAKTFGFSRVSFYKIQQAFKNSGFLGLLPKKRGPHGAHKLTDTTMEIIYEIIRDNPDIGKDKIVEILSSHGVNVHKRSIQRVLAGDKKKHYKTK